MTRQDVPASANTVRGCSGSTVGPSGSHYIIGPLPRKKEKTVMSHFCDTNHNRQLLDLSAAICFVIFSIQVDRDRWTLPETSCRRSNNDREFTSATSPPQQCSSSRSNDGLHVGGFMERERRILASRLLLALKAPCTPPTQPARPRCQPTLLVPQRAAGPPRRLPPQHSPHTSPPPPPPPPPGTLPHDAHVQHRNCSLHSGHRALPTPPQHTLAAATAAAASHLPAPFPTAHLGCRHRRRHGLIPTLPPCPVPLLPVPFLTPHTPAQERGGHVRIKQPCGQSKGACTQQPRVILKKKSNAEDHCTRHKHSMHKEAEEKGTPHIGDRCACQTRCPQTTSYILAV